MIPEELIALILSYGRWTPSRCNNIEDRILFLAAKLQSGIKNINREEAIYILSKPVNLKSSCKKGHINIVKFLVHSGVNIHCKNGKALHLAIEYGHLDIVRFLIEIGANIHSKDDKALYLAFKYDHIEIVRFLLENGAKLGNLLIYAGFLPGFIRLPLQ